MSVSTTNPFARLPLITACPTRQLDVSFVLRATTEQDRSLFPSPPAFEHACARSDLPRCSSVPNVFTRCARSWSPTISPAKSTRFRLASGVPSLACSWCSACLCRNMTARVLRARLDLRYSKSVAEEGGRNTGSGCAEGGKRRQAGPTARLFVKALRLHSRQKRCDFPSPGTPVCPSQSAE